MATFWKIVGVALLGWAAWDIYAGYTFLYDVIYQDAEPVLYWVTITAWILLGLSCFYTNE